MGKRGSSSTKAAVSKKTSKSKPLKRTQQHQQQPSKNKISRNSKITGHDIYEDSDSEEDNEKFNTRKSRTPGGGGDYDEFESVDPEMGNIDSEDDEEIDEDEAFGTDDEKKYGHFFEGKESGEDEEEDVIDEEDEGGVDLSDMLMNDETPSKKLVKTDNSDSEELEDYHEEDDDFGDSEDEHSSRKRPADNNDDDETPDFSQLLQSLDSADSKKLKKPRFHSKTEAFKESEFNISTTKQQQGSSKLELSDLVSVLKNNSEFGALKKQLEGFDRLDEREGKNAGPLQAPLPSRLQDKVDRKVAFQEAKKELNKWVPMVKKNREADHISFVDPTQVPVVPSTGQLVNKFEPTTSFEKQITSALEKSGLTEKKQQEKEDLELSKLSKEELMQKRAELQRLRSLLFFQEQKQKKIAKIKSKTYRKLHKDKTKSTMTIEELKKLDPEAAEEEILKMETARAQERMTLKHKSSGKWAREIKNRGDHGDDETREAMMEQLRLHEQLTKRIQGVESSDEEEESENEDRDEKARAIAKLDSIAAEITKTDKPTKGVMAMKFMQREFEKQRGESLRSIQVMKNKIERGEFESDDGNEDGEGEKDEGRESSNNARLKFSGKASKQISEDESEEFTAQDLKKALNPSTTGQKVDAPIDIKVKKSAKPLFQVSSFVEDTGSNEYIGNVNQKSTLLQQHEARKPKETGPNKTKEIEATSVPDVEEPMSEVEVPTTKPTVKKERPPKKKQSGGATTDDAINPWLNDATGTTPTLKSLKTTQISASSGKIEKAMEKIRTDRKNIRQVNDEDEEAMEIDLTGVKSLEVAEPTSGNNSGGSVPTKKKKKDSKEEKKKTPIPEKKKKEIDLSDADSEFEGENDLMIHDSEIKRLSRRDIMQLAFASDNVVDEFEEEKEKMAEEGIGKDEAVELPGWGSWSGSGIKKKKSKEDEKLKKREKAVQEAKSVRVDSKLRHVVINEKKIKKAAKYMLAQVPPTFENRDQYEHTIRAPVGPEWNSMNTFQKNIQPKVETKAGIIIHPAKLIDEGGSTMGQKKKR